MNADEMRILEYLNESPSDFVSVVDVSKRLGKGRRFKDDKLWARPILRRLEMDGFLEVNDMGDYRIRDTDDHPKKTQTKQTETKQIDFKQALKTPGVSLGDTTIIRIGDVQEQGTASRKQALR
jgi:hypothetical protein